MIIFYNIIESRKWDEIMEKNRDSKVIAVIALIVGVLGLSLGFAAFSNTLTIKSSADVTMSSENFDVDFSSISTDVETSNIVPKIVGDMTADSAVIDNSSNPIISNLKAHFTYPGQKATYEFYAYNKGAYDAFLKRITYNNVDGSNSIRVCTPAEGTTEALAAAACEHILVSVKVGDEDTVTGSETYSGHTLMKSASDPIIVTIQYEEGSPLADGDFDVKFGDIELEYRSTDQ